MKPKLTSPFEATHSNSCYKTPLSAPTLHLAVCTFWTIERCALQLSSQIIRDMNILSN